MTLTLSSAPFFAVVSKEYLGSPSTNFTLQCSGGYSSSPASSCGVGGIGLGLVGRAIVGEQRWERFSFVKGDIRNPASCAEACEGADYLLHQAALGSVPRSIADPATSTAVNVCGFVNVLIAAREALVRRIVYASSSSV